MHNLYDFFTKINTILKEKSYMKTDEEIIKAICGRPSDRKEALHIFFSDPKRFQNVRFFILKYGGNEADCEDIFQEAFIIFDRNIRQGKYKGESSLATYFMGIIRLLWLNSKKATRLTLDMDALKNEVIVDNIEIQMIDADHKMILYDSLSRLGDKCKELLLLTGITSSNVEIAQLKGYSSAEMAKKEVYRCRERFRNFINEHPQLRHILKSMTEK